MNPDWPAELRALVDRLSGEHGSEPTDPSADLCPDGCDATVHELVYSVLLWESSHAAAGRALSAIRASFVDYNELRIGYPEELAPLLDGHDPRGEERAERLRAALNAVFARENRVSLARLTEMPKRDARAYLQSLEGVPAFVGARVCALSLGAHAFPADERISSLLAGAGVVEADAAPEEVGSRMERVLRAGEALPVYLLLEASAARVPPRAARHAKR